MRKIKVAFCTDGIYPFAVGGMQKHSRLLLQELIKDSRFAILVIHPHKEDIFPDHPIIEAKVQPLNASKNYLMECYWYSKRVYEQIKVFNPDIIYSQGLSAWYGIKEIGSRLIINPHGLEPYQAMGLKARLTAIPFKAVFNFLFSHSRTIISLGGKLTTILRDKVGPNASLVEVPNAVVLPEPIATRELLNRPLKVLFLARFANNKGIDILFAAIEQLDKSNQLSRFHFTLAGGGPLYREYLERNKYSQVELPGMVSGEEIDELFRSHDLFILPTLYEGMPTVVLEAMSYGLPVIVSDVGATNVLVDEENGILIRPGEVQDVVNALLWFESLPVQAMLRMGQNSRKKVEERFTWEVVGKQHADLFVNHVKAKE